MKAGARFREGRAALEGTGPIGGREKMALQTKPLGSLSQADSGTVPSPTRAAAPTRSAGPSTPPLSDSGRETFTASLPGVLEYRFKGAGLKGLSRRGC